MVRLRTAFRRMVQRTGYDIHKIHLPTDPGRDPYYDIGRLMGTARPIIFDVGANAGQTTSALLRVLPSASIHAFEPHPEAFQSMRRRCIGSDNVFLIDCALGAEPGEQTL